MVGVGRKRGFITCKTCDTCGQSFYYLVGYSAGDDNRATAFFMLHQLTCREHQGADEIVREELEIIQERLRALYRAFCAGR
jgi:hypothetical protein